MRFPVAKKHCGYTMESLFVDWDNCVRATAKCLYELQAKRTRGKVRINRRPLSTRAERPDPNRSWNALAAAA
jgi:hypothetical protein